MDLIKKTCGEYRGVYFEINEPHSRYEWAYYIHVNVDKLTSPELAKEVWEQSGYMKCEKLMGIKMHYGCTYTRHITNYIGNKSGDKAVNIIILGCDYHHYWDEVAVYDLESVLEEVKGSIFSLIELGYKDKGE